MGLNQSIVEFKARTQERSESELIRDGLATKGQLRKLKAGKASLIVMVSLGGSVAMSGRLPLGGRHLQTNGCISLTHCQSLTTKLKLSILDTRKKKRYWVLRL